MTTAKKLVLAAMAALLTALCVAAPAIAVLSGRSGRIAFTSGREGANDNNAQLYLIKPDGTGLSAPFGIPGVQNRHVSFSPDRTKAVFAAGTPGSPTTEEYDLFVRDFEENTVTPLDATQLGDGLSSDHPAWSPDGTRIAYEQQPTDNSAERDIMVKTFGSSAPAMSLTSGTPIEFKPAWSADSEIIFYALQAASPPASNLDIYQRVAVGGPAVPVANATGVDEYQPSISPDGSKLCFTLQTTTGNPASAEIYTASLQGLSNLSNLSNDNTKGDINCSWSPDGQKIAYSNGVFGQARLVVERADGSDMVPTPVTDDEGSNNFDGNAEWVPDGSPDCPDAAVGTRPGTPVTIELECVDTGPAYERTDPNGTVANDGAPAHGTLSDDAPLANPSTVVYTPDPGFTGTDRIVYTSFDDFGFGTDRGTVTIDVREPGGGSGETARCAGLDATVIGTAGPDGLRGTPGPDVIAAGAGDDRVRAGGGRDVVCGGAGRDRLGGGPGRDRLLGQAGGDRLGGGPGRDRCVGGAGRDRDGACETSK